jgi:dihydrofolate reductase
VNVRQIINSTFLTLDGAVEDPHLWPSSGSSNGRAEAMQTELLATCDAVLMGRRTYESFAAVWPTRSGDPFSDRINAMRKLVVSTTLRNPAWNNTTVIAGDVAGELARLKEEPGGNIVQYGIGPVTYTLLEHGLQDELRLWLHPLILGRKGPSLPHFHVCPTTQLRLLESTALPNGEVMLRYGVRRDA